MLGFAARRLLLDKAKRPLSALQTDTAGIPAALTPSHKVTPPNLNLRRTPEVSPGNLIAALAQGPRWRPSQVLRLRGGSRPGSCSKECCARASCPASVWSPGPAPRAAALQVQSRSPLRPRCPRSSWRRSAAMLPAAPPICMPTHWAVPRTACWLGSRYSAYAFWRHPPG
jgi:hypothetical protein